MLIRRWVVLVAALVAATAGCKSREPAPRTSAVDAALVAAADAGPLAADAGPPPFVVPGPAQVVTAPRGMVVSEDDFATNVGVKVLQAGGNAVDAAVATAFALAVTHPAAGNLGGGGFAVVRGADGQVAALDFRETAPASATPDMYKAAPEDAVLGARAAGVPGSVAGLHALHKKYGKKPWKDVVAPAIALARDGFVVDGPFARGIAAEAKAFASFPASAALFLPDGAPPKVGSTWKNPDLAAVLTRIAARGPKGFYEGETAKLVVDDMARSGGLITAKDLAGYRAEWREPVRFEYRGYTAYSMPLPSSGGVVLAMVARMLAEDDLKALGWHSAAHVHLVSEAWRRAYAARNQYLGDPAFVKVPLAQLLDGAHVASLRATITPLQATPSKETPVLVEGTHTTHFAVVDEQGMVVALTTTVNASFGSKLVVAGAGFLLNNEMDDFATRPGEANMYGLVQGAANAIAPGKRMHSSMSPTVVVDAQGQPFMVLGAQGGSRIITAVWQIFSNVVDFGMDLGRAVGEPRFHHQHLPDTIYFEQDALAPEVDEALRGYGHAITPHAWPVAVAPTLLRAGGQWTGAADPRRGGLAAGY
jgi:gamma-glutamyltranspeptidase/glutathione hydrolase